jgi:hypothetical protein
MQSNVEWENLEQVARVLGQRWARRVKTEGQHGREATFAWPYTLHDARQLVDETFGTRLPSERREPLALILDRCARAAWRKNSV